MASPSESSDEEDATRKVLEKEISELRLAKKELFEKARPVNEELERIAKRERECVDIEQRLIAKKHDREKQKQAVERLIEVESELKHVKSENVKLSDRNSKLKRSLDEAAKFSKRQNLRIAELESRVAAEQELSRVNAAVKASYGDDTGTVSELQKQLHETRKLLNKTTEELRGTRHRLSEVQERLTVAEQVTAATQQRELQESGNSDELQLEPTPQQQSTTRTGDIVYLFLILGMIYRFTEILEVINGFSLQKHTKTTMTTMNIIENHLHHNLQFKACNCIL